MILLIMLKIFICLHGDHFYFFSIISNMIPYFPPPRTHKLKAGIAYSVLPIKYLMLPIIFFYSFAILTNVNGAMLTTGRRVC
jgi:hypothetical protein